MEPFAFSSSHFAHILTVEAEAVSSVDTHLPDLSGFNRIRFRATGFGHMARRRKYHVGFSPRRYRRDGQKYHLGAARNADKRQPSSRTLWNHALC